jgi:hypothetical protein
MRSEDLVAVLLLAALGLCTGCTTQSHAPDSASETRELRIKAGDEIRVVTTRRERIAFTVTEIRDDRFVGVTIKPRKKEVMPEGEPVEVRYDELALLEVTRFSKGAATVGALAAVVTVAAFASVIGAVGVMALPPAM